MLGLPAECSSSFHAYFGPFFFWPFPASSVPVRCFGLLSLLLLNRYAFFLHDRVPPMPQRSCALIISHASFSRFLRLHRRLQAPPFSFLGKSLFLVSSKICRPFSSRAPCFVSLFPSRICAVHGYLFLFPSRFGSWPPAPSVRRLRGNFPDDVATLWEGDGLGARVCGLRRRRPRGTLPRWRCGAARRSRKPMRCGGARVCIVVLI